MTPPISAVSHVMAVSNVTTTSVPSTTTTRASLAPPLKSIVPPASAARFTDSMSQIVRPSSVCVCVHGVVAAV
jgi:hypothetical protein